MGSKRHEMFRDISKMGFEIVNGGKHYPVLVPRSGEMVGILPRAQNAYGGGKNGGRASLAASPLGEAERTTRPLTGPIMDRTLGRGTARKTGHSLHVVN